MQFLIRQLFEKDPLSYVLFFLFKIIGASQFHRECMIDKLGFPLTRNEPLLSYGWDIPAYPCRVITDHIKLHA